MIRQFVMCCLAVASVASTASAGDRFYFGPVVVAPPVVYAAPVVTYQPAYVVPTTTVATYGYPVSTVSYSTHVFAPVVPVVSAAPVVVAPAPAVYVGRPYYRPAYGVARYRRFRGYEVEIERDGDVEIDFR